MACATYGKSVDCLGKLLLSLRLNQRQINLKALKDLIQKSPEAILSKVYADNLSWWESHVRQHSGDTNDARDVFQEAVSAAWLNLKAGRFEGDAAQFNAYVRQICKYKWINHLKSFARTKFRLQDDFSAHENEAGAGVDHEAQLRESRLLQSCFNEIGDKCRQVLEAFYYKRQSLATIAGKTGDTEESIKTIKYRCMKKLRACYLEKHGQDE